MNLPLNIHPQIFHAIQLLSKCDDKNTFVALEIIESTVAEYDTMQYPSYSEGLAGIGCGIQYAIDAFMPEINTDDILSELDDALIYSVYYLEYPDLTLANGLIGIALYFLYRLQDRNASEDNINTLAFKSVLLSVLDILSDKYRLNGYYCATNNKIIISKQEEEDVKEFLKQFIQSDICSSQAEKLQKKIANYTKDTIDLVLIENLDLSDVTIVIPIRVDSLERRQNLHAILDLYTKETNANLIVIEADRVQSLDLTRYNKIKYSFIKDENPIFHFTHYRNEMIKQAKTPIVAVWDVDIIVPTMQFIQSVEAIRKYRYVLSYPYDGICYGLSTEQSIIFRENLEFAYLDTIKNSMHKMFGNFSVGGIFLINRSEYIKAGLENEYFVGWGPEDVERLKRITILDLPVHRVSGNIFHLWHPRNVNSNFNNTNNLKLKKELIRISKMTKQDLKIEIDKWKWVHFV